MMPLDHFVSQVHLKNFYNNEGRLVGIKKDDLRKFYAKSEDVCRRVDGSTNGFLSEPRAIEAFLKAIEPKYNVALESIRQRAIDEEAVYVIAGFVAYIMTGSPTAMRIGTPHLAATLQSAAELLDAQGVLPPAPDALGGKSMSELLEDGTVRFNVDEKYPQAIGISGIEARVAIFGNALWDVMFADPVYGGFFTSDFPVALGPSYDNRVVSKIVPLAPDIAIRIHPQLSERGKKPDFSFPGFRARFRELPPAEMREINRELVRAAESMVFCNADANWLLPFVRKHRDFRVESIVSRIPSSLGGKVIVATQKVSPYIRPSAG